MWFDQDVGRPKKSTRKRKSVAEKPKNHYEALGVERTADDAEIKASFRLLARQWHPDLCKLPEAEERFKQIQAAYETLQDEDRRRDYDAVLRLSEASKLPPDPIDIVDSMFGVNSVVTPKPKRKKEVRRPSYDDIPEGVVDRIDEESSLGGLL